MAALGERRLERAACDSNLACARKAAAVECERLDAVSLSRSLALALATYLVTWEAAGGSVTRF